MSPGGQTTLLLALVTGCSPASGPTRRAATGGQPGFDVELAVPSLSFASLGDTRPARTCHTLSGCNYPSALVGRLYQQVQAVVPKVPFVVVTGDYQYNSPGDGTASWQLLHQYLPAAQQFRGGVYPAMGNHECNGYTDSNCVAGGPLPCDAHDACGVTENLSAFESMLQTLGVGSGLAYYTVGIDLAAGLSAKFVVTAPNAWDQRQASWLEKALAMPTTYTFLVQHEPNNLDQTGASAPESLAEIRKIVQGSGEAVPGATYPVTLWIVGHTHNFDYDPAHQQVINGLGGAPTDGLTDGEDPSHFYRTNEGAYLLCRQQSGGNPPPIQCALYESKTNGIVGGDTTFAVNADGTPSSVQ